MAGKLPKNGGHIGFLEVFQPQDGFQNRYIKFLELNTGKLQAKFQVLSMKAVQMNVPFGNFPGHRPA